LRDAHWRAAVGASGPRRTPSRCSAGRPWSRRVRGSCRRSDGSAPRQPGFLLEPLDAHDIPREVGREEFQSDPAAETQLRGEPHFRHHTRTEGAHHLVWAEPRAAAEGHGMRRIIRRLHESHGSARGQRPSSLWRQNLGMQMLTAALVSGTVASPDVLGARKSEQRVGSSGLSRPNGT
jgi:hypothetical protein